MNIVKGITNKNTKGFSEAGFESLVLFVGSGREKSLANTPYNNIITECKKRYKTLADKGSITTYLTKGTLFFFVGMGKKGEVTPNDLRETAGNLVRQMDKEQAGKTAILVADLSDESISAFAEGAVLGGYVFNKYFSKKKPINHADITFVGDSKNIKKVITESKIVAEAVNFARNLVNEPGNIVNPATMAIMAKKVATTNKLSCEILDAAALKKKKYNAILAVGEGSNTKPCLITLKYNGAGKKPYTAFVGKGITFDSGGISIKPSEGMGEMKDDMSGSAIVLGAIKAISELKLPCNVMAVLACAENMPSGAAYRPGDVITAGNGKTIEVISTDAEGRMVLADGIHHACQLGAIKVIDIATLTGAAMVALGLETAGIIANDDKLASDITTLGKTKGEDFWQLPSSKEAKEAIKSTIADLKNSGGRYAGCMTGGLFIGEFVKEGTPWAHLDIAGPSNSPKTAGFKTQGGTAFGLATLVEFAKKSL